MLIAPHCSGAPCIVHKITGLRPLMECLLPVAQADVGYRMDLDELHQACK